MNSAQIRHTFLKFFENKHHKVLPSAPMVLKNDPTLMFTNAGMNQFKDIFLGHSPVDHPRVVNSQKCLRVSGKHNDLEEVGHDTYHHTMFEMLGNWSFGDYFKKEAIQWGWELLTEVYGLDKERLYVTVFGGDSTEGLDADQEAYQVWRNILPDDKILYGSKKDNFWEMGYTGPCGPCSEIHIDLRSEEEIKLKPGREMVNTGHPEVIELWNLVFIQFNRKNDGKLAPLPAKHIDTGMGFERLAMALQKKKSNYDTDIFQPIINETALISGKRYGVDAKQDIALRVIADHLRAIAFAIADGQLPSNNKAGYVIRRILRRAVRYGYTFLDIKESFIHKLVAILVREMGDFFPELKAQQDLITKVIAEEEQSFLRTLSHGIKRFETYLASNANLVSIDGDFAFELFDTYGFPVDLTQLMAREYGLDVDMQAFQANLDQQKQRSRLAAEIDTEEWVEIRKGDDQTIFLGYETLEAEVQILKFRKVKTQKESFYQIVFDQTPFYAESGGQIGDRGVLVSAESSFFIRDTQKENDLIVHIADKLPQDLFVTFIAKVDAEKRRMTMNHHSATHLMHTALKRILGDHVEQRGSLVDENHLRFDFSHFAKMTPEQITQVEHIVNAKIRENISVNDQRNVPIDEAKAMGAVALFGEKYGEYVRVITFDPKFSIEFCGGTHVPATGQIGMFKIVSETAIAAGIRRIVAITADKVEELMTKQDIIISNLKEIFKNKTDIVKAVNELVEEKKTLEKQIELMKREKIMNLKSKLSKMSENIKGINFIAYKFEGDTQGAKDLAFMLKDIVDNLCLVLGYEKEAKAGLTVMLSDSLVKGYGFNAGEMVRELAKEIEGSGGGQPHFATAGGKNPKGIEKALKKAKEIIEG